MYMIVSNIIKYATHEVYTVTADWTIILLVCTPPCVYVYHQKIRKRIRNVEKLFGAVSFLICKIK